MPDAAGPAAAAAGTSAEPGASAATPTARAPRGATRGALAGSPSRTSIRFSAGVARNQPPCVSLALPERLARLHVRQRDRLRVRVEVLDEAAGDAVRSGHDVRRRCSAARACRRAAAAASGRASARTSAGRSRSPWRACRARCPGTSPSPCTASARASPGPEIEALAGPFRGGDRGEQRGRRGRLRRGRYAWGGPFDGIASTTPAPDGWFPAGDLLGARGHHRPGCRVGRRTFAAAGDQERDRQQLDRRRRRQTTSRSCRRRPRVRGLAGSTTPPLLLISESNDSTVARCFDGIMSFR